MRSILRWSSLVASGAVLAALGARRVHLASFPLFLLICVALALLVVVVFLLTRPDETA
ncbi:MAG: hypothetical protein HY616_15135 [Candidatus Rokubacteria bacterium]|nr:hypothetical protein [Candidatus Rokubacteria bacterium]